MSTTLCGPLPRLSMSETLSVRIYRLIAFDKLFFILLEIFDQFDLLFLFLFDDIVFKYEMERENVLLVTLDDFRSCSSNRPIRVYQTGLDKFPLVKSSHLYFIGGFHDHCLHGQKVDIRTLERQAAAPLTATPPSMATPTPSSTPSSLPPRSHSPSPSPVQAPGSGASVVHQGWALTLAVVAFVVAFA